ncbi:hypothetical protein [Actinoplanes xinjiangensis]|nr:hypothetical protein [Actinoplanes xinjiangensis]
MDIDRAGQPGIVGDQYTDGLADQLTRLIAQQAFRFDIGRGDTP